MTQKSQKTKKSALPPPPSLQVSNRFECLSESLDFGGLEVLILENAGRGRGDDRTIEFGWPGKGDHRLWRGRVRDAQRHA